MAAKQDGRRGKRRQFTDELKAGAVRRVLDEDKTVAQVARDLDLTPSALGGWVKQARADRSKGGKAGLTTEERAELAGLRKELRLVKMERDILGKAVAFFAKENA
ncbi:MAG: transposase [Myxococcales bacterium]|nr:transposase [Myxococcales bacterium]